MTCKKIYFIVQLRLDDSQKSSEASASLKIYHRRSKIQRFFHTLFNFMGSLHLGYFSLFKYILLFGQIPRKSVQFIVTYLILYFVSEYTLNYRIYYFFLIPSKNPINAPTAPPTIGPITGTILPIFTPICAPAIAPLNAFIKENSIFPFISSL